MLLYVNQNIFESPALLGAHKGGLNRKLSHCLKNLPIDIFVHVVNKNQPIAEHMSTNSTKKHLKKEPNF